MFYNGQHQVVQSITVSMTTYKAALQYRGQHHEVL
jgi:hypothetical protein